jgi:hypothetical protein
VIPDRSNENGEDLRQELTLPIGNHTRRLTVTVVWKPLDADRQDRFEADVQLLLAQLARKQIVRERNENAW